MQDFPRSPIGQAGGDVEAEDAAAESQDRAADAGATAAPSSPPNAPKKNVAVGNAMKALFESSDVSIRRGDETRVMSRAQQALADLQHKSNPPPASPSTYPPASASEISRSAPPGPRVDKGLWIVLAVGLFAIAGWMLAYSL